MASRKEQKEQARAKRLEQERLAAAKSQRTRRIQIFGGIVVAAVVVIVVAIVVSTSGGGGSNGLQQGNSAKGTYASVNKLLHGIPQNGVTLGNPHAKVTMTYFGDLQCPICRAFTLGPAFPKFIQDQVRTGNVKVKYRSFCTASCNNQSFGSAQAAQAVFNKQQVAAYAAGKQQRFWDYAELFYHEQGAEDTSYVNDDYLEGLANQIPGFNVAGWKTDRGNPALLSQVQADEQSAASQQLPGTPTLIMTGSKGSEQVSGSGGALPNYDELAAAVQQVQ